MNKYVKLLAGVSAGVMMTTTAAFAGDKGDCYEAVAAYENGMPSIAKAQGMEVEKQVELVSGEFKKVISASTAAHRCYVKSMKSASDADRADLKAGMKKAGAILVKAQSQFSGWIDEMSVSMMSDIAPAAGATTEASDAPSAMEASLDVLIGSYMLLDDATEVASRMTKGN